jgi:hypothetical protein
MLPSATHFVSSAAASAARRGFGGARQEVDDHEALHAAPLRDDPVVVARARRSLFLVVAGDRSADHDAGAARDPREDLVQDGSAHVVEEDVDPVGTQLRQPRSHVLVLVVDGGVEARLVRQPGALLGASGDADDPAALALRDLAGDRARGACSARDHHHVVFLQLPHLEQSEVGRDPREAQDRQREPRVGSLGQLAERSVAQRPLLPAQHAADPVTGRVAVEVGLDDLADGHASHHLADSHRRDVVGSVHHPAAHGGLEGEPAGADQHLSVAGLRHRRGPQFEVALFHHAHRTGVQQPLSVRFTHGDAFLLR